MRTLVIVTTVLLAGFLTVMADVQSLAGEWVGSFDLAGENVPFRVRFEHRDSSGKITAPTYGAFLLPLSSMRMDGATVLFEWQTAAGVLSFRGQLAANKISGELAQAESKGNFELIRLADIEPQKYFGVYQLAPDRFLYVRTWDELGEQQLTYLDDTGRVGPLYAISDTEFFSGPGVWMPLPVQLQVSFREDGLLWKEGNAAETLAKKVPVVREEEVSFRSGDFQLGGSLFLPSGEGKHPAMVFVHGSAPTSRDFFGPIHCLFARHGFAVLAYDKRGVGKSTGHWLEADFGDLARDALAAVEYLKKRSEIDASKIGLWGGSQAGWIIPLAASQSTDVAFIVIVSGPGVSPAEQGAQALREEMNLAGIPQEKIQEALARQKADLDSLRSEEARESLEAEVRKLKEEKNEVLLAANSSENPKFLLFLRGILDFDGIPHLERVQCPALFVYGELDRGVPVAGNKEKVEAALRRGGNSNFTIQVLPKANHVLLHAEKGTSAEFPQLNRFADGFFDTMLDWLRKNVQPRLIPLCFPYR